MAVALARLFGMASVIAMSRVWWKQLAFPTTEPRLQHHIHGSKGLTWSSVGYTPIVIPLYRISGCGSDVFGVSSFGILSLRSLSFTNLKWGSSAVRAISKTLGERGIPLTSNQIQCLVLAQLWMSVPVETRPRVYQWKWQDHKEIHPKVSFLWCHMVHSAQCLQNESLKSYLALKHHANNTGWTAKVQLVVSLSRVAFCLRLVAFLPSRMFACFIPTDMLYFLGNKKIFAGQKSLHFVLSHPLSWGTAWKKRVMG